MCIPEITNQKKQKYQLNMCIAAETIDFHMRILLFCMVNCGNTYLELESWLTQVGPFP